MTEAPPGAPRPARTVLSDRTIRQIAHLSIGGTKLKVRLRAREGARAPGPAPGTRVAEQHTLYVLDVIAEADWIVDMGPEGGDAGGRVVLAAPPEEFLKPGAKTHTAKALREFLSTR